MTVVYDVLVQIESRENRVSLSGSRHRGPPSARTQRQGIDNNPWFSINIQGYCYISATNLQGEIGLNQ